MTDPARSHVLQALRTLISELTNNPLDAIQPSAVLTRDLDLDSLVLLELVLCAEDRLGLTLPDAMPSLVTVADVVDWVVDAIGGVGVEQPLATAPSSA